MPRVFADCHRLVWLPALLCAASLAAGCPPADNPYRPYPEPDYAQFTARVQPIMRDTCAFLGCHGTYDRPLTLFAVDNLRGESSVKGAELDPDRMSEEELLWNYDALRMRLVDETSAEQSALLLKCLDPAEGGLYHADELVVYEDRDDPDFQLLRDWIASGL